jgi:hypothetical protein
MNPKNLYQGRTEYKMFFMVISLLGSMITFSQMSVAVAPMKMNVLYIGVDNPISVAASGGADEKVTVSISGGGGSVVKEGAGNYIVRVAEVTDECTIQVDVDGKVAGTSKFRVRRLPAPAATVGGYTSGSKLAADAFRAQAGLGVYLKDFPFEVKYKVLGFKFSVNDDRGGLQSADCLGSAFSSTARQYIDQYVKSESIVTIENIRVQDSGGREFKLPSLVYYIK